MDQDNALNVQNGFFNQVRKDHTPVTICLNNGQKISGVVKSFDRFTLLVDAGGSEQVVFKHAVATISIAREKKG
jgi:host factor-I protein